MSNKHQRLDWIDAAKGIGILMVLYGHNWLDWKYCYLVYSFHMPLFFFLSGYTFSDSRKPTQFILHKMKTLLIPYVFFAVSYVLFHGLMNITHAESYDWLRECSLFVCQRHHTYLWFLPVLFLSELLIYSLCRLGLINNKLSSYIICLVLLAVLHYVCYFFQLSNMLWCIDLLPVASFFILLGSVCRKNIQFYYNPSNYFIMILAMIAIVLATLNYRCFGHVDMLSNNFGSITLFYLTAISAIYTIILILQKINSSKYLLFIGRNSLVLYGFHKLLITILFILWAKFGLDFNPVAGHSILIAFVNVCLSCLILAPVAIIINKRLGWLIGKF